jgi:hypothetical protein
MRAPISNRLCCYPALNDISNLTDFVRDFLLVGQDGILRGGWQPALFEWIRHFVRFGSCEMFLTS